MYGSNNQFEQYYAIKNLAICILQRGYLQFTVFNKLHSVTFSRIHRNLRVKPPLLRTDMLSFLHLIMYSRNSAKSYAETAPFISLIFPPNMSLFPLLIREPKRSNVWIFKNIGLHHPGHGHPSAYRVH